VSKKGGARQKDNYARVGRGKVGEYLGLQWQWEFDLDGISDENVSVSVARKFGSCPTIGWQTMARMIEE
jgi:hypothetical protein